MKRTLTIITTALLSLAAAPAFAQDASASESSGPVYERGGLAGAGLVLGLKAGVGFGQLTSDFGVSPVVEFELGWCILPFPDLQIFTTLQYVNPKQEGTGTDARLTEGPEWSYQLDQKSLVLTPGLLYRIPVGGDIFRPYVAAGARFYFNKTTAESFVGPTSAGVYEETGTTIGPYGALGGDLFVGPGSILLEVQFGYSAVDEYILRETNNGALNIALGYRFFL